MKFSSEFHIIRCLLLFQVTAEAAMFNLFRKPLESKKPSVPETEADGFVLLGECFLTLLFSGSVVSDSLRPRGL